jgi:hypothetical protein
MNESRLLLDLRQPTGFGQETIIDIERRFHMYEYGCCSHMTQAWASGLFPVPARRTGFAGPVHGAMLAARHQPTEW